MNHQNTLTIKIAAKLAADISGNLKDIATAKSMLTIPPSEDTKLIRETEERVLTQATKEFHENSRTLALVEIACNLSEINSSVTDEGVLIRE